MAMTYRNYAPHVFATMEAQDLTYQKGVMSAVVRPGKVQTLANRHPRHAVQDVCSESARDLVFSHLPPEAQALKEHCKKMDQSHYYYQ